MTRKEGSAPAREHRLFFCDPCAPGVLPGVFVSAGFCWRRGVPAAGHAANGPGKGGRSPALCLYKQSLEVPRAEGVSLRLPMAQVRQARAVRAGGVPRGRRPEGMREGRPFCTARPCPAGLGEKAVRDAGTFAGGARVWAARAACGIM